MTAHAPNRQNDSRRSNCLPTLFTGPRLHDYAVMVAEPLVSQQNAPELSRSKPKSNSLQAWVRVMPVVDDKLWVKHVAQIPELGATNRKLIFSVRGVPVNAVAVILINPAVGVPSQLNVTPVCNCHWHVPIVDNTKVPFITEQSMLPGTAHAGSEHELELTPDTTTVIDDGVGPLQHVTSQHAHPGTFLFFIPMSGTELCGDDQFSG